MTDIDCRLPFVVVTRDEWEFLFEQLKSTAAVVDYVHRVAEPVSTLGGEAIRYYELAEADAKAPPNEVDSWVLGGRPQNSVPRLPKRPAGYDDPEGHAQIRTICEDIAASGWSYEDEFDRTRLLGVIDGLLPGERSETGRHLIELLAEAARLDGDDIIVRARTVLPTRGEP